MRFQEKDKKVMMPLPEFITRKKDKTRRRNVELFHEGQKQFYRLRAEAVAALQQHVVPWFQTGQVVLYDEAKKQLGPMVVVCSNGHRYRYDNFYFEENGDFRRGCPMCRSTGKFEDEDTLQTRGFAICDEWGESHVFHITLGKCPLHSFAPAIKCSYCGSSNPLTLVVTVFQDEARKQEEEFFAPVYGDIGATVSHPCLYLKDKDIEQEWQPLLIRCQSCNAPL